jgi:hypothetical protein
MHYLIFFGIFGLPVVVCAGMFITRLLENVIPEKLAESGRVAKSGLRESEFRMSDLADTFIPAPIEQDRKQ